MYISVWCNNSFFSFHELVESEEWLKREGHHHLPVFLSLWQSQETTFNKRALGMNYINIPPPFFHRSSSICTILLNKMTLFWKPELRLHDMLLTHTTPHWHLHLQQRNSCILQKKSSGLRNLQIKHILALNLLVLSVLICQIKVP